MSTNVCAWPCQRLWMPAWGPQESPSPPPSWSWAPQTQRSPLSRSRQHPRPWCQYQKQKTYKMFLATSIMSSISSWVGLLPRDLMTAPNSLVDTVPSPSWCHHHHHHNYDPDQRPCQTSWMSPWSPRCPRPGSWQSTSPPGSSGRSRSYSPGISYTPCSVNNNNK